MRIVVQRVTNARVRVDDQIVGEIEGGLLVLVGFGSVEQDSESTLEWAADKIWGLRVFSDEDGKMNRSAEDIGGALLIVSQFTLYGDVSRGKRPSFVQAARPDEASSLYDRFVDICGRRGRVETGRFGAMMQVELVNDGPVTILMER